MDFSSTTEIENPATNKGNHIAIETDRHQAAHAFTVFQNPEEGVPHYAMLRPAKA